MKELMYLGSNISVNGREEADGARRIRREVLGAKDEEAKEMETYREENSKVKSCSYQSEKKVNAQIGRKMNQDVNGNMKFVRA